LGDEIKKKEMGRACGVYRERKRKCRVLVEKSEGTRPLGRPRHRWKDSIKMDLQEMTWGHGLDRSGTG